MLACANPEISSEPDPEFMKLLKGKIVLLNKILQRDD